MALQDSVRTWREVYFTAFGLSVRFEARIIATAHVILNRVDLFLADDFHIIAPVEMLDKQNTSKTTDLIISFHGPFFEPNATFIEGPLLLARIEERNSS